MIELLEQHGATLLFVVLCVSFSVIALAEMISPRRCLPAGQGFRWLNNLGLACVTTLTNRIVFLWAGLTTVWWANQHEFGLLPWLNVGWWPSWFIVLLVLGLEDYVTHRLMHAVPVLWRVHAVHHSDTEFDLTTTYRNHPVAAVILLLLRLPVIVALGAPVSVIVAYEAMRIAQNLFSHSNIRLPEVVDRYLRLVLVTPDFHRTHHCSERVFTDSNFSSILPWFDYLLGSYRQRPFDSHGAMQIGLEQFRDTRDTRLDKLLAMPLRVSSGQLDDALSGML
jgi:sterol desaturase/sphingolipid hydroxylase (fatty acid hydroxylase superfamily)